MLEILHEIGSKVRHSPVLKKQEWLWRRLEPGWQGMFRQLSENKGFLTHINGEVLRLNYEWGSRYDRSDHRIYEPVFYTAMTRLVGEGMTVFDIGAHIGIFTLGAAKRVGSKGKVFAFEPAPETARILRRHVTFNGFNNQVEVVPSVVSDVDGKVSFYVNGISMAASLGRDNVEVLSADRPVSGALRLEIESVTLDHFCDTRAIRPDVLKIDVEGAEVRVLRGAWKLLRQWPLSILCEVHPQQMQCCGSSLEEFRGYLDEAGYVVNPLDEPNPAGIFHTHILPHGKGTANPLELGENK